ncbi:MAG: glutamate racemase [Deltaproteobacteria bacterium]|nr:glutamate racemase [Candidatus Zymogenaceae bacterium]
MVSPNHPSDGAIGVFDSGVGGLTVLREVLRALPSEDCIYLGDTARIPYGNKSPETVVRFARKNADFLVSLGIKFLIVACNTAASAGMDAIREHAGVPTIGVIRPGAARACKVSKNGRVGVIGTRATIQSGAYEREIQAINRDMQVFSTPCPLFVPLAEEGWTDDDVTALVAQRYLAEMAARDIDTLVLGCTHYPLLKTVIAQTVGYEVKIVDSATPVAQEVKDMLAGQGMENGDGRKRKVSFYVTDDPDTFARVGGPFLGIPITEVTHVDITA